MIDTGGLFIPYIDMTLSVKTDGLILQVITITYLLDG